MSTHDWAPVWELLGAERPEDAVILFAKPLDVEATEELPGEYALSEAPFDDYELVELTHFDRPVARGRVAYEDGIAAISPVTSVHDDDVLSALQVAAIVEHLSQTAHSEGAEVVYAVMDEEQAEVLLGMGFAAED